MAVNIKQTGDVEIVYAGPWKGIDVQAPQTLIDPAELVTANNWIFRNRAISSRPRFIPWTPNVGGAVLNGVGTFLSPGGFYHTFATAADGSLYNLNGALNSLDLVSRLPHLATSISNPLQWRVFNSTNTNQSALYMVSGSNTVASWDGTTGPSGGGGVIVVSIAAGSTGYAVNDTETLNAGGANAAYKVLTVAAGVVTSVQITAPGTGYTTGVFSATTDGGAQPGVGTGLVLLIGSVSGGGPQQDVIVVSGVTIGARYIGALAQHMILLNTTGVTGTDGVFTIRYSAVGLPLVFDPSVNINAGFYIMIDFSDGITGAMFIGRVAYIFHRTGITEMAPTGVGTNPFEFNHIWNSQDGTGSIYPYTIAQYGQIGAFVSTENVYMVQNYSFQPIGGQARDGIYQDIHTSLSQIGSNQIIGALVPAYNDNYIYTVYQIYIPISASGPTVVWQYSVEGNYWERFTLTGELVGGVPAFCLVH